MALTKDTPRDYGAELETRMEPRVAANTRIYNGAFLGVVVGTGHVRGLVALDVFAGVAMEPCDNVGGAAAAKRVKAATRGQLRKISVTGVTDATSIGAAVYASDDGTLTTTSTNMTRIGKVYDWVSGAICDVAFDVAATA